MIYATTGDWQEIVFSNVQKSRDICVAIDKQLVYIALNQAACNYLKQEPGMLLGKVAIQVYPEIIASRNHRNILRALSGIHIPSDIIESRLGDILEVSYTPVLVNDDAMAIILTAVIHMPRSD